MLGPESDGAARVKQGVPATPPGKLHILDRSGFAVSTAHTGPLTGLLGPLSQGWASLFSAVCRVFSPTASRLPELPSCSVWFKEQPRWPPGGSPPAAHPLPASPAGTFPPVSPQ